MVAGGSMLAVLALFASMVRFTPQLPPSEPAPVVATTLSSGQVAADPQNVDHPLLALPIAGISRASIRDSWGDPRENGLREHRGTDIMAAKDTPVLAAAQGTVDKLFFSNGGGGISIYIRSPNRLWSYYYAHLSGYAPGLHEGQVVRVGEPIGFVGDTGNAGTGNYHLHFGMSRMQPGDGWWKGEAVNPYRLLAGNGHDR
jgi:murein DD-endopeptidase MepM/ murein hydrolase activator NlpD